jgi:hypothetical protein
MQKLKLDLLKFAGVQQFTSKSGIDFIAIPVVENNVFLGKKGAYLEITLLENRDGQDQYENDGFAAVDIGKERREAGEKGPIVGKWKHIAQNQKVNTTPPKNRPPVAARPPADPDLDMPTDDIPF